VAESAEPAASPAHTGEPGHPTGAASPRTERAHPLRLGMESENDRENNNGEPGSQSHCTPPQRSQIARFAICEPSCSALVALPQAVTKSKFCNASFQRFQQKPGFKVERFQGFRKPAISIQHSAISKVQTSSHQTRAIPVPICREGLTPVHATLRDARHLGSTHRPGRGMARILLASRPLENRAVQASPFRPFQGILAPLASSALFPPG
jgi:hypothetical protein